MSEEMLDIDEKTKSEILKEFHNKLKSAGIKVSRSVDEKFMQYLLSDFWQWTDDNIDGWIRDQGE